MLELFSHGSDENPANSRPVHVTMQVDDVKAAFVRAIASGAAGVGEPVVMTLDSAPIRLTVQSAFVRTPGGAVLEFIRVPEDKEE